MIWIDAQMIFETSGEGQSQSEARISGPNAREPHTVKEDPQTVGSSAHEMQSKIAKREGVSPSAVREERFE